MANIQHGHAAWCLRNALARYQRCSTDPVFVRRGWWTSHSLQTCRLCGSMQKCFTHTASTAQEAAPLSLQLRQGCTCHTVNHRGCRLFLSETGTHPALAPACAVVVCC